VRGRPVCRVTLRASKPFPLSRHDQVFGRLRHAGPPVSLEEMDAAVARRFAARRLLEHESVWLGLTVLLETTWVLESAYDFPPAAVAETVELFLGLPNVHVEGAASIATFDRQLARNCRGLGRVDLLA
jgi:hypothetical protein